VDRGYVEAGYNALNFLSNNKAPFIKKMSKM
jgi:hypothetical protein